MRKISQAKANACAWFWPMKPFVAKFSGKCWRLQRATPVAHNARSDRGPQGPPGNPQLRLFSFGQIAEEATPVAHSARSDRGLRIETEDPQCAFFSFGPIAGRWQASAGRGDKARQQAPTTTVGHMLCQPLVGGGRGGVHNRGAPGRHRMPHEASRTGTQIKETEKYRV